MMRLCFAIIASVAFAMPLWGQSAQSVQMQSLGEALQLKQTFDVMQSEALAHARDIAPDLFGTADMPAWSAAVSDLFDPARAWGEFIAAADTAERPISDDHVQAALAFFTKPLGQRLILLELSARRAMLAPDVKDAAESQWQSLQNDPMPSSAMRVSLLRELVLVNDLIESNISAALNGNLAFLRGLGEGGGFSTYQSDEDLIAQVAAQAEEVRRDTENWLYPYLAMAYAPLSDDELQAYILFSKSDAGQALSLLMFRAFDRLGTLQSRGMGLVAGRLMAGQDI